MVRDDDEIAERHQTHAAGDAIAVDAADHRHSQIADDAGEFAEIRHRLVQAEREGVGAAAEVRAGAKGLAAGAGQNNASQGLVLLGFDHRCFECLG